jgi:hypothetical protein
MARLAEGDAGRNRKGDIHLLEFLSVALLHMLL